MIIFLDIDGPMIPMRSYIFNRHASFDQELNPECLRVLRAIIDKTKAQIVFNTTHNRMATSLRGKFADAGFNVGQEIHPHSHTCYPDENRLTAIQQWLGRHPDVTKWVALDDAQIADERAFPTDPNHGIGYEDFQHARHYLLDEPKSTVLI